MASHSSSLSTPSVLHPNLDINSSEHSGPLCLNGTTFLPAKSSSIAMSCFTMIFGAISNITALGILIKSRIRFRRQAKAPFLILVGALLLADLGGHVIPGGFALYLHIDYIQRQNVTTPTLKPATAFCQVFGASMVFFGLCPLLFGCAMAVERCFGITQPLFHTVTITVTRVRRVVLLLSCLALLLAILPLCSLGTYVPQFPGTWCFLPLQGSRSIADTNLTLVFSCLGLSALTLAQLCNILSGLALLQARVCPKKIHPKSTAHCIRRASSSSFSSLMCSLDVEMMVQLAVITVVSCVCWSPFLLRMLLTAMQSSQTSTASASQPDRLILLGLPSLFPPRMHNAASVSASVGSVGLLRFLGVSWSWSLAAGLGVYLGTRSWRYFYIAARTAKRDVHGLYVLLRVKLALWRHMHNGSNIPSIFAQTVKLHPNKPALIYEATGETWTFTQLDELSNSVAQWARCQGWVSGDVVAIFMESRPLQVALWLGLAKVGVESALINFNLRHDSLLHCIGVSASRAIVFGAELADGKKVTSKGRKS
ncbi:hypothetical protein LDENG_00086800 [Lucifuga dentata]|nr:hypothetical protein LDENG_00086800 [Lucifuga dentata]